MSMQRKVIKKKQGAGAVDGNGWGILLVGIVALVSKVLSDLIYQGLAPLELGVNVVSDLFCRTTDQSLGTSKLLSFRLVGEEGGKGARLVTV